MLSEEAAALLHAMPGAVILVGGDGALVAANAEARAQPWDLAAVSAATAVKDCIAGGEPTEGELALKRPARPMHIGLRCTPFQGGALCVLEDRARLHELERLEEFARATDEMAQVGGWELDLTSMTVSWSDQVCRIHEVSPGQTPPLEEAINFYAPEARPVIKAAISQALETGEGWDLELPFITTRGREIWVRAIGRPILEEGRCVRLFGTFQDITSRKEIELELQAALHRTRKHEALFDSSNALLAIANPEGYFIELNGSWERTLGLSKETLCSRPFLQFIHPDDVRKTLREIDLLGQPGHETLSFVNRYLRADGRWAWLSWKATPDPEAGLIYAVAHDITVDREIQQQLGRLAMIASRTDNAVLITDASARVEWINEGYTRMTGYTLREVRGRRPGSFLHGPETDAEIVEEMRQSMRAGRSFTAEVVNYRKSGDPYWVSLEVQPMSDERGQVTGFMAIESDITERKRFEATLIEARDTAERLASEAQAASHAKSEFLAMMSHEIRTPLNGVLGTAELLGLSELDDEQRDYLDTIQRSGRALLRTLNNILNYSKLEAGGMELSRAPFGVKTLVEEVTSLLRPEAEQKELLLQTTVQPDVPETLLGDSLRVRQVLVHLVSNAIKFTERGAVHVTVSVTGDALHLEVRDTGVGISDDSLAQLFQPFTQADNSATRRFGGSGLGLAICRQLVSLMGGEIGALSTPAQGSTFWFEVPLGLSESDGQTAGASRPMAVLLVEDHPVNQQVIGRMLEYLGCQVTTASDGLAAVQRFSERRYGMVLMDCHLPQLNGWEATLRIRAEEQCRGGNHTPIIALINSGAEHEEERCLEVGMDDSLTKPVHIKDLEDVLARWRRDREAA
jgi:PAS domain S-box-containing protein